MNDSNPPSFRFLQTIAADLSKRRITFPTFSKTTVKVRLALNDPDLDLDKLARVISTEPLLGARLIQMANSAALNPGGRPAGDVKSALLRLGRDTVKTVAVSIAIERLKDDTHSPAYRAFGETTWRHGVLVAAVAHALAAHLTRLNADEALFAGLVHDIGHFYLLSQARRFPELEGKTEEMMAVLAEWHPSIGQAILHEFQLPDGVVEAVGEHESGHYRFPLRSFADVITASNVICSATNPVPKFRTQRHAGFPPEIESVFKEHRDAIRALAAILRGG